MASFQNVKSEDLEQAEVIQHLRPESSPFIHKAGGETWSCAWAPDTSCFAWSCGNRMIKIIPWNRITNSPNWPDSDDTEEEQNTSYNIPDHSFSNGLGYNRPVRGHIRRKPITIDAGELVWAVAFGSSSAEFTPNSVNLSMRNFHHAKDLVLATGLHSGRIRIWDVNTGKLMLELVDHRDVIKDLKFAPDGSLLLVSASRDGSLKLWDLHEDGNMTKTLRGNAKWIYACCWSPDSKHLASVGNNKSVVIWNMVTYQIQHKLVGHHHDVVSCDFSPDGALLATSSYDTRVIIWDAYTGENLHELGHLFPPPTFVFAGGANGNYVRSVSFSHDGTHLTSVADDSFVRIWRIFDHGPPQQISTVNNALCCSYSPDGSVIAVGNRNGCVTLLHAPMVVENLQYLCRMAIRRVLTTQNTDKLGLPVRVKEFLKYRLANC